MTGAAIIFMVLSWGFVLGLTTWAFRRILRHRAHHDPDGIGPAVPPEPAAADTQR